MQKLLFIILLSCLSTSFSSAQDVSKKYNKVLADSLGADDYGMKMYSFVILKTGTNDMEAGAERDSIFRGHMNNIGRLVEEDKLIVAGPFGANDDQFRGLFIFTEPDIQKTKALLATDPAIASEILAYDIYPWYGSAALGMYLPFSEEIAKKNP
jgi:uncharacterized protein YciI